MNRCRPYRFVHPLRGCVNTRGDAHPYQASVPAGTWWSGYLRSCQAAFLAEDDWSFAITTTHTFAHLPSVHYSLITPLTPSPQKNATPKRAFLTLAQDITAVI